ncbi:FAD-dependent oxidoreductase [Nonomuraea sp. NPDC055795]
MTEIIRKRAERVLVIGAGVSGLTTALSLSRAGFEVVVAAEKDASQCVSVVAGALWEWPPAVCGYHHDQISLSRSKGWCMESYEIFDGLAADPSTGVFMRVSNFYFTHRVEQHVHDQNKMNELAVRVRGFERDPGLASANGVNLVPKGPPACGPDMTPVWLTVYSTTTGKMTKVKPRLPVDVNRADAIDWLGTDEIVAAASRERPGKTESTVLGAYVYAVNVKSGASRLLTKLSTGERVFEDRLVVGGYAAAKTGAAAGKIAKPGKRGCE